MLNYHLLKMNEKGILTKLHLHWTRKTQESSPSSMDTADSLGYDNVLFPFIIVIFGVVVAIGIVIFEKAFFNNS